MNQIFRKLLVTFINRKPLIAVLTGYLVLCFFTQAHAQNKIVVVPIFGDDEAASDISNIVTVALEGGDFTNPLAAMRSIEDASENNPYLIAIAPGTYSINQTLIVKDYVSIVGSGRSNTKIVNTNPNRDYTLELSSTVFNLNFSVSDITIENSSEGNFCGAIEVEDATARLTNIVAIATECRTNIGLNSFTSNSILIQNSSIIASGGNASAAISISNSVVSLDSVNIQADRGSAATSGIGSFFSDIQISNSSINVTGSGSSGLSFDNGTTAEMISSTVNAPDGTGIALTEIDSESKMRIRSSSVTGGTASLFASENSSFNVSSSSLVGGVDGGVLSGGVFGGSSGPNTGEKKCANSDNGDGEELTSGCLES